MANHVDTQYEKIAGVHILEESGYRKYARTLSVLTCETCGKQNGENGVQVRRCTGCLGVGFCSKECQRQLWPKHKQVCNGLQIVLIIEDLVRNSCSDTSLLHFLRVALIFKLGLLSPTASAANTIPCETVHLHISPISAVEQVQLVTGELDAKHGNETIPGYLTLGINEEPMELIPLSLRSQNRDHELSVRLYKQARKEADAHGRNDNPIALVRFGYDTESMVLGIEITPDAFETARGSTPEGIIPPSMKDIELQKPLTVQSPLKFLNEYVKQDTEDRLKLRRDLRRVDKMFTYRQGRYVLLGEGSAVFRGA